MSATGERTLAGDLEAAARIGATGRGGISRFAWSEALAEVTAWVADELERLGLEPSTDAAGNLIARWPAPEGKAVMAASHLDTVPDGGGFDGVLGVLGAVEAVRILRREGFEPARPIWIGAFMDEEGTRFGTALFGSRAFVGDDLTSALEQVDAEGVPMREAIVARGLDPARVPEAEAVGELAAYLELHVEQGPVLDAEGAHLGVVDAITGVLGFRVHVDGVPNHAGTTPMDLRRDALAAASRMVLALRELALQQPALRATVGKIATTPGTFTVIPGTCDFTVDLRPARADAVDPAVDGLRELVARIADEEGVEASVREEYRLPPAPMDAHVVDALEESAREQGVEPRRMWSGAGHDAMVIARRGVPTGMVFVPSRRGISHSPEEWTEIADCELGARVLAGGLRRLAS